MLIVFFSLFKQNSIFKQNSVLYIIYIIYNKKQNIKLQNVQNLMIYYSIVKKFSSKIVIETKKILKC